MLNLLDTIKFNLDIDTYQNFFLCSLIKKVKILHNPNEFKTIGSLLPVGALVVTEFFNYEVLSFANDNQSSKWDLNRNFQLDQLSSLGLFMKIENIHNTWKRIHVVSLFKNQVWKVFFTSISYVVQVVFLFSN